ncbi:MAG: hypothetical protein LBG23_00975 [Endomicrobium sp.]|jgi:hypothetical protein|nr:hypothetical protein [Endomicrobium sp.]
MKKLPIELPTFLIEQVEKREERRRRADAESRVCDIKNIVKIRNRNIMKKKEGSSGNKQVSEMD